MLAGGQVTGQEEEGPELGSGSLFFLHPVIQSHLNSV